MRTYLIAVILDLQALHFDATGVVCGVARPLASNPHSLPAIEVSYLSIAKAGTIMVEEEDLNAAIEALRIERDGTLEP